MRASTRPAETSCDPALTRNDVTRAGLVMLATSGALPQLTELQVSSPALGNTPCEELRALFVHHPYLRLFT